MQIAKPEDKIVFLYTNDLIVERCINLIREYFLDHRGFKSSQIILKKLEFQSDPNNIETIGIRHLVNTLIDEVEAAQKSDDVIINATAGLKAEIVYSTMIGMVYKVPIKYMYETFSKIVTFTPIELDWNTDIFLQYSWFFKWLDWDNTPRAHADIVKELQTISKEDQEKIQAMLSEPDTDGSVFLSPMGEVVSRRFLSEKDQADAIPYPQPAVETNYRKKIALSIENKNHHPTKGVKEACEKIAALPWVVSVIGGYYENTTRRCIKNCRDDGSIVMVWADKEKAERINIQTTARGKYQTRKVAEEIKRTLDII